METRIAQLDAYATDTMRHLKRIDERQENAATKADLDMLKQELGTMMYRSGTELIAWMAAIAAGVIIITISVMSSVVNNAAAKTPPQPPAPIVIYAQPAKEAPLPESAKPSP
jgi:hypothetical protein